jgi:glycosyltransferase involved in cell wall biosynthesis
MYIEDALNSLLTQTYKNIEIIIIDDCSKDDCPKKIESWIKSNNVDCKYIHHAKNLGITKTSNEIVKLASGKYITLFATDDIMLPERIEKQVKILEETDDTFGLCYAHPKFMDEDSQPVTVGNYEIFEGDVLELYLNRKFVFITPSTLIKTMVYKKIGLYDEKVLIEDFNFFIRLLACYKVKYSDYPCIVYRLKKEVSPIFQKWNANKSERYYSDRIISNFQALHFIQNKNSRAIVHRKIKQYLKSLAANNSKKFYSSVFFLLFRGYFRIPIKAFFMKLRASIS